ncbi:MAG: ribbon-helix-helix domain-containing protein [Dolichospermum sp.]
MSKRFSVTVPDTIFEELEKMADTQGRTTANLAAFLIESGIREIKKTQAQNPKES